MYVPLFIVGSCLLLLGCIASSSSTSPAGSKKTTTLTPPASKTKASKEPKPNKPKKVQQKNPTVPRNSSNNDKPYYEGRAIDFLREYGRYYHLFDIFFNITSDQQRKQEIQYQAVNVSSSHLYDKLPVHDHFDQYRGRWHVQESLETSYNTRDYSQFHLTHHDVSANVNKTMLQLHFTNRIHDIQINRFNNRFRYGLGIDDRFLTVGLDHDPWAEGKVVSKGKDGRYYLYFIGYNTALEKGNYTCDFSYPLRITSIVEVEDIPFQMSKTKFAMHNVVRCPLPTELVEVVLHQLQQSNTTSSSPSSQASNTSTTTKSLIMLSLNELNNHTMLLKDIVITPSFALDRRHFHQAMHTMMDNPDDALVTEWLIYNILIGVEHFYIYYNPKTTPVSSAYLNKLQPFLDANIITLIYFPFHHTEQFNSMQFIALNSHLHIYRDYTEWMSYWDVDEFFLPSAEIREVVYARQMNASTVLRQVQTIFADKHTPGIIFDSMEMECNEAMASYNYYHGGNNILWERGIHRVVNNRVAVTTHCDQEGLHTVEYTDGHGKMIIRPAMVHYLYTPHRLTRGYNHIAWTNPEHGGLIRHFDRFRNTHHALHNGKMQSSDIKQSSVLKKFTLFLLKELLGVSSSS